MSKAILDIDALHLDFQTEFTFDQSNPNWVRNPDHNTFFLRSMQNLCNDLLSARGVLFLNDVLDQLGISRTQAGQLLGWSRADGDFVDFQLGQDTADHAVIIRLDTQHIVLDQLGN